MPLPSGRGRALLALLVLNAGRVISSDRLIDDLWGETVPSTVQTALHGLVSELRKRLEPSRRRGEAFTVLRTAPPGYVLAVEPTCVDANRFRLLLDEARAVEAAERAAKLRQALDLWRGPALADFTYEPFAQREIAALEELRLGAIEDRIDADLALGRAGELVPEVETLVAEHPSRERLREQLMLTLYRSGRQAEALKAYRAARRTLLEELGIEPGPRLRQLEQEILRQDSALEPEPAAERQIAFEPAPAERPWLEGERRIVTVAFLDLGASSAVRTGIDPEALRRMVARSRDVATAILARHGATVEDVVGDVVVGVFGTPVAHEDDALRAVRAAVEVRDAVRHAQEGAASHTALPIRAGIETGEAVVAGPRSGRPTVSGAAVHIAAAIQRAARDDDVLVGEVTRRALGGAALLESADALNGPDGELTAWKLVGLVPGAAALARHVEAPIVGRDAELVHVMAAFEQAVRERAGRRLTVLGDAGIGKSRLGREVAARLSSRARILTGRCPAYGDGVTFWPLREIVLEATGAARVDSLIELLRGEVDARRVAAQVGAAIGLTQEPTRPDELFPAIRRFFEALARRQPLVVVLEDAHWVETMFLDLVEYVAEAAREPLLFLCLARPDLIEERLACGSGDLFLEPLGSSEIQLIAQRSAGGALAPEAQARVVETAQGNPLFAEQLVAAVQDEHAVSLPASLHALLAARLDRLGPAERDLLRSAAVIGQTFSVDALSALIPEQARPFVERHLRTLERKRLIELSRAAGREFGFQHVLIQVAAYRSTTREDRARLHERFAEWLRTEAPERRPSLDELLGYHLERAVAERRALGVSGEHDAELAVRAGEHLAVAGSRAAWRYDVAAAANLLSRAYTLLPTTNPQRRNVMRRLAEAYQVVGRLDDAESVLTTMLREAEGDGDLRLAQISRLELMRLKLFGGPDPITLQSIRNETDRALSLFREPTDEAELALAYYVRAYVHFRAAEMHNMEQSARLALAHADRAARLREAMASRMLVAWAVAAGPTPVPEAIHSCEQLVDVAGREHPIVLSELATLRAMLGEIDDARALLERARKLALERMRGRSPMMILALAGSSIELAAGDIDTAERELEVALDLARAAPLRDTVAQTAARLSLVVVQRDTARAAALAELSRDNAPREGVAAQALWRAATGRTLASRAACGEAERLAREAVDLAPTEMLNLRAELLLNLAEVLQATGDEIAAESAIGDAIELHQRKGNVGAAARSASCRL